MDRRLRFVLVILVAGGLAYFRSQRRTANRLTPPASLTRGSGGATVTLAEARRRHPTQLTRRLPAGDPVETPPAGTFDLVRYSAPSTSLAAYVTPDPKDGQRHPAMVWITGGDCNTIGDVWSPAGRDNDQTAAAYRTAGVVLMFPSLRGGNDGPGRKERFCGETDDVAAAADYLAKLPWVDPKRIYLGGHSTGGTMALLTAETTDKFRAVFSFGPVADVRSYGDSLGDWPCDIEDVNEAAIRGPGFWLASVRTPTFVLEGDGRGNADSVRSMRDRSGNLPLLHWAVVPGKTHFSILAPANELLAKKVVADTGPTCNVTLTDADVAAIAGG